MTISLILAHPEPTSLNHAIAHAARESLLAAGHSVRFHDLYAEQFDAMLPPREAQRDAALPPQVQLHCREISQADGVIIVHPNWWGMPPAILKGWVDRVLRAGVAYAFADGDNGEGIPVGLLKARSAIVFNTSNTPHERERDVFGDPLENLWRRCILEFCGVPTMHRRMYGVVCTSSPEQRALWLQDASDLTTATFATEALEGADAATPVCASTFPGGRRWC